MKSHTIPKKLLEQFAYDDPITKAKRLWRYQSGRPPYWKASPDTATRIDGHFGDPRDKAKEAELEHRLNVQIEQPVKDFIAQVGFETFVWSKWHVNLLADYVTLLFHRSKARKMGTREHVEIIIRDLRKLREDREKIMTIAGKWTRDIIEDGVPLGRPISNEEVAATIGKMIADYEAEDQVRHTYAETIERAISRRDELLVNGSWGVIRTYPENPFVIGDAPVVTWRREKNNILRHGLGFGEPNVEAFLPVSPLACLHMLPDVQRNAAVMKPSVAEINVAQASFASEYCFTNLRSEKLNELLQPHFNVSKVGVNVFTIRHRSYVETMFRILMNRGMPL